jgi:hypothetical protein
MHSERSGFAGDRLQVRHAEAAGLDANGGQSICAPRTEPEAAGLSGGPIPPSAAPTPDAVDHDYVIRLLFALDY